LCQIALVYPNTYAVGMSSLGFQMVYRWINEQPGALAERFFCEEVAEAGHAPPRFPALSVENQRPLEQFDLVAFSISYELDYLGVVRFLMENRVTLRAAERDPEVEPILIAGGVCLLVNRLPIYDLADVLVVGDGEGTVAQIVAQWVASGGDRGRPRGGAAGCARARFLQAISALEGVEVTEGACRRFKIAVNDQPLALRTQHSGLSTQDSTVSGQPSAIQNLKSKIQNSQPLHPHFAPCLERADAYSMIVTPHTELGARCLVEIARGCPYRCRFCFIGHCLPYRARPFDAVREMIERGRRLTPRFGLIAPAVGSHPDIERICEWCRSEGLEISFSSLRLEDVTPAMLDLLAAGGQQSVTVAPEAGSETLRRALGKRLSDEQVIQFAADAVARGLTDLRLYFMVGLPGEEDEDIEAIARLAGAVRQAAMAARPSRRGTGILPVERRRPVHVTVTVAVFIPKPGTPFAKAERPTPAQIKNRLKRLHAQLGRMEGITFRLPSFAEAEAQRILTWADRDVLSALIETARESGSSRRFVGRTSKSTDESKSKT